ncbi:T9SS type B sorting domain-containing protein [Flavobacterium capsici]|uniref:Gliding motility-associated C-terminal domain-containing protein n=1 Tax=Flavobacterium capsici TaxID=3075618 RepID=A0AA96EY25_9FLAO|nr:MULTISPECIES: gliding motility-associated C-terminal domain-containing protein [unclassified Flavobacterium]WNM20182.1 gliding motility-associated C-terminal domain-containing protein [Flavobacterium sp. PMR2A8]WNM21572.1 gliding motility-associated C-terminal domain-containing protein [Flavobacterium sp. PMTSA4]
MGITTTYKKIFFSFSILFFLIGIELSGFSQCPTVSNSTQSFCDSQSPTVGSLVATDNGGGIRWYANASDPPGSFLSSSTSLVSGEDYFVDDNTGACGTRQSVVVSIVSRPFALLGATTLCRASIVSDLNPFVIGNNIKWYTSATGGSPLNSTDSVVNGTYYASQTNPVTGCETTRTPIIVQVLIVPPPTGDANQVFCSSASPTIANLVATGTNVSWYASQSSGFPLDPSTPLVNGQIYFAESYIFPCPSTSRLQVTVTLNQPNNAGGSRVIGFCESIISSQPPINLFNQLTGSPQTNGVWSGSTATSNGHLGTLDVSGFNSTSSPYIFTYTVSSLPCPDAVSTVTININSEPTVTVTTAPVCQGTPATVTATVSPAGTYTYTWTVPSGATNPGNVSSFNTTVAGVYSVVVTDTTTTCPSQPAQTTVVINTPPTVTVTSAPVCQGTPATVTATVSPAGTYTYTWTVPSGATNPGNVSSFNTTVAGVYSVVVTDTTTTCPSQPAQTTVVINTPPTVTVTSAPVCQGTPATVTATVSPAGTYTYTWTVPSGATNPGNVSSFNTTVAGVYSVVVTDTTTTCPSQPAQTTVVINTPPTVTVTSAPVCQGTPATVTATVSPAGTYTYTWTVPSGATNPGNVSSFNTTVAGVYSVVVTDTTTTCPSQPAQTTVVINTPPTVTVTSAPVCQGTPATVTATVSPAGTYTYTWTVPSGATNPGNVSSFNTTVAGVYSVVVTDTTTTCPSQPAQTTVVINTPPTVTVTSAPVCQGTPATVTATVSPAGTYTYTWTVPSGATNPGNVSSFNTTVAGVYSVVVTDTTTTCPSQPAQTTVVINTPPTVTVTSAPVCQGTPATVTATVSPAGTYTYTWTVPSGATNPGNVSSFNTTVAGVYSVVVTDTTTTCPSQPAQTTVVINTPPTVTVTSAPVCQGTPATVTATVSPAGTYTYTWTVPAGATNPGNVSSFNTTVAGVYSVVVTDTTTTCPSQPAQTTVVINTPPTVTVTSAPVCQGTPATVTATVSPAGTYTYTWTVPSGATNPGNVSSFNTTVAGVYSVVVTDTTTTCPSQPAQTTVVINTPPTVTVTSAPVCQGTPATVTATVSPAGTYTYTWTVPSGATNPGNVSSFNTTVAGVYSVVVTDTTTTCPSQPAQTTVVINTPPTVTVTSAPVCQGTPATVTATVSPAGTYTYTWTVPSGATNPGNVSSFNTTVAGVYSVVVTDTTTTCPSQPAQTTVVINTPPTVTVTSAPVCQGTPATVTATVSPAGTYTYTWTVPSGATNPGNVSSFNTTVAGVYSVVVTDTTTTCPSQPAQTTVVINTPPTVTVTSAPVCQGTPATVTATVSPAGTYTYTWTVPSGATNPGNVSSFNTTVAGVYSVVVTDTTTTCPSQPAQTTVVINTPPTVTVTSAPVCQGTPATVTATVSPAGTYTYTWTVPSGATNPGNVSSFNTTVAGVYSVVVTDTTTTCPSQPAQTTVVINTPPTVTVTTAPVCQGTPATVTATVSPAGTYTYTWTVPAGATNPGNVSSFNTTVAGVYSVVVTDTTTTCPSQPAQTTVVINTPPTVTVTSAPVCQGTPATVTATVSPAGTYTYTWTVPAGATNPGNVSSFNTTVAGVYSVVVTDTTTTCPSQPAQTIVVINPIPDAGVDGAFSICSNQNSVDLFDYLNGTPQTGGTWSPTLASGTSIFNPAVDTQGVYTYTITGIAPCNDDTATVNVTVVPGPEAGNDNSLQLCLNSTGQDLFLLLGPNAQSGGTWSPALASGTGFFDPSIDAAGDYTYTLTGPNPCDNDEATITVTIDPIPDAGTDGSHLFCTNDAAQDLFNFLNGTPQSGGTWSPTLASGTGVFNPLLDVAGVYTYTVGGTNCTPASAQVTVTLVQSPIAGADGQLPACANDTSIDLTSGLDGTQGSGTFSDDNATGALTGTIFNPSLVSPGTYNFTYTVGGGTDPCLFDTAVVTVVVTPLPNAGTFAPTSSICSSAGTIDLNTLLTGQDSGGDWTDSNNVTVNSIINILTFSEGTYDYTYTVTNSCGTDTEAVQFTILPVPTIISSNISVTPICIGSDAVVNLSGMVDGTYTLDYDLSGANVLANQSVQVTVVGGNAAFTILAADIPNSGTTTITITNIQNTTTNCSNTPTNVTGTITINPLVTIDNVNVSVANACLNSDVIVQITNAVNLPDGTYQFSYTIPTGNPTTGNSGDVTITSGNGQFTIPAAVFTAVGPYTITIDSIASSTGCSNPAVSATASFNIEQPLTAGTFNGIISVCPSTGVLDLASLLDNESTGGVWTDNNSVVVTSPLTIISFAAGTYTHTYTVTNSCGTDTEQVQFTILANPTITTANVTISPACLGTNVIVNLNGMADGTYTLTYDLTGANNASAQTVTVTITSGIGNFSIPTALLPNTGITVISFTNIVNTVTNCTNNLTGVSAQINVRPLADIDSANLSAAAVCFGDNVIVAISGASNLIDGTYQFNYSIPGATPTSGNTGDVVVSGGNGQFQLSSSLFPNSGTYTITITGIISATSCVNANENASTTIVINALPSAAGANLSAQSTCVNFTSEVTISNASGLPDGSYTIIYDLTGANSATTTITINVVGGQATFTIPASELANEGDTTITVTDIMSDTTLCMSTGATFAPYTFSVAQLGVPVLVDLGNEFCDTDNPTVADLSANVVGGQTVVWYDAPTGGNAYNDSDALINGNTYYGAYVSQSGCEGPTRLAVVVDTTVCDELIIPDGFSPNNDGINDDFHIVNLDILYPNFKLEIYNRYGNLIYVGNKNTPRWDGTTTEKSLRLGSNLLPSGVYFFIIYFNDGTRKPYQGRVYLNR